MQRLLVTFSRAGQLRYVSHLDMMRIFERAIRRARLPLAYTSGFTPHARIAFAAPLAVGMTAGADLMDLYLTEPLAPAEVAARLAAQMLPGLAIVSVTERDLGGPSLQASLAAVTYVVEVEADGAALSRAVAELLAREQVPFERRRDGKAKSLDLRRFVEALAVESSNGTACLRMKLRVEPTGTARPDEVLAALGLGEAPCTVHRERLWLADEANERPS